MIFLDVLLPVVLVAGCGVLVGRLIDRDPEILSKLAFYLLTPALLFYAIYSRPVSGAALGTVFLFVFVFHGLLFAGGYLGSRLLGMGRDTRAAVILTLSLSNTGNYGLPILLFAFKEAGFALGLLYILAHMAFQITFGVAIASWRKGMSIWRLPFNLLRVPWIYAFGLALLLRATGTALPEPISRPIELLYGAAIPMMLLLLGIELARVKLKGVIR